MGITETYEPDTPTHEYRARPRVVAMMTLVGIVFLVAGSLARLNHFMLPFATGFFDTVGILALVAAALEATGFFDMVNWALYS